VNAALLLLRGRVFDQRLQQTPVGVYSTQCIGHRLMEPDTAIDGVRTYRRPLTCRRIRRAATHCAGQTWYARLSSTTHYERLHIVADLQREIA